MKKILGLDLGTTSIGWAFINEFENKEAEIIKIGVRVNPLSTDEVSDFEKGKSITTNSDRTAKRAARRNLQRFKLRRENLISVLKENKFITEHSVLAETGKNSTFETLKLRASAVHEKVTLEEFARILLNLNKKRGYKSSRKSKNVEEGNLIDGMEVAKKLYESGMTPGQYVYQSLLSKNKFIPEFYKSDLQLEFDKVWNFQKQFYPDFLTDELYDKLKGQGGKNTRSRILAISKVYTAENKGTRDEIKLNQYKLRSEAIEKKLDKENVAYVLVEINNNLNNSSNYLGAISDRSKSLYFNKETIGEYLYKQILANPHTKLKSQVFYRQDYLDEFERIWEFQKKFHPQLTEDLKTEIRDVIIFYQRKLKSQKGLISLCTFESRTITISDTQKKKIIGPRVIPKSSPLFQEFKIWSQLNTLSFENTKTKDEISFIELEEDLRNEVFQFLNLKGRLKSKELIKLIFKDPKDWKLSTENITEIEGNNTNKVLYQAYQQIAEIEGYGIDWDKKEAQLITEELEHIFKLIGVRPEILTFDSSKDLDEQISYQLWHLLYSAEDDYQKYSIEEQAVYGKSNIALKKTLVSKFGFKSAHAKIIAEITFPNDFGSLSAKAIKKIIPGLQDGLSYSDACQMAGYNHSNSMTKDELMNRTLLDRIEVLKKNSLRNPVVEKVLNQMINLVNELIDTYGKPDEVRIELARELKKTAKERALMTKGINEATRINESLKKELKKAPFNIANPTRNDIVKYKLYKELEKNGHKTLYSNTYIPRELLFSKEIDVEHIIPQARLFDDSFANKTLEYRQVNQDKGNNTAIDYIAEQKPLELEEYQARIQHLYKLNAFGKSKYLKLLMAADQIPDGFINRDLRDSQYIAKKAKEILQSCIRHVATSSGIITAKLREDWDLVNLMKELNLPKYRALGLTIEEKRKNDQTIEKIKDWTKRNDHRHHAMDALTVAFTSRSHVQYLNYLNARKEDKHKNHFEIIGIENKITELVGKNKKRRFKLPISNLRHEAKNHLENILVSHKTKNKVVTRNTNKTKKRGKDQFNKVTQLTPRGQLHKETVYGLIKQEKILVSKIDGKFDFERIQQVCNPNYRRALMERFEIFQKNPKKAFTGKNDIDKNPLFTKNGKKVPKLIKLKIYEDIYTIKKAVGPDLVLKKVIDGRIRKILEQRLELFHGDAKLAFGDLSENPIWLNEEKGISIKSVSISGISNAEALHAKTDHSGKQIFDSKGEPIPVDFVSTGNNHHVAIYQDKEGNLQEKVVSFFEAVTRVNQNLPVIDKYYNEDIGWQFLFTMKQNEMFLFPNEKENFNPTEIDLFDEKNLSLISKNLFRVQKFTIKDYFFRHHLETNVENIKELKNHTWKREGLNGLKNIVKIRLNHLGKIVQVGEY